MRVIITAIVMTVMCIIIGIIEYVDTKKRKNFNEQMKKFHEQQMQKLKDNCNGTKE